MPGVLKDHSGRVALDLALTKNLKGTGFLSGHWAFFPIPSEIYYLLFIFYTSLNNLDLTHI